MHVVISMKFVIMQAGLLKFEPPLSKEKTEAMESMRLANGIKTVLVFFRRAWPEDCQGVVSADAFCPEIWFNSGVIGGAAYADDAAAAAHTATVDSLRNPAQHLGERVYYCSAFFMSRRADAAATMGQDEVIARVLSQLAEQFGLKPHDAFLMGKRFVWGDEPWIRGAYMSVQVGPPRVADVDVLIFCICNCSQLNFHRLEAYSQPHMLASCSSLATLHRVRATRRPIRSLATFLLLRWSYTEPCKPAHEQHAKLLPLSRPNGRRSVKCVQSCSNSTIQLQLQLTSICPNLPKHASGRRFKSLSLDCFKMLS